MKIGERGRGARTGVETRWQGETGGSKGGEYKYIKLYSREKTEGVKKKKISRRAKSFIEEVKIPRGMLGLNRTSRKNKMHRVNCIIQIVYNCANIYSSVR